MLDWEKCPPVGYVLIMKTCTRAKLIPFVLCATGAIVLCLAGCRKEEAKPEVPASSPQSYMKDKAFMGEMKAQKRERQLTIKRHIEARAAYEAALKDDPKGEKPETQDLKRKMESIAQEYETQRKKALDTVRRRITPKGK